MTYKDKIANGCQRPSSFVSKYRYCSSKPCCQGFQLLCLAMLLPQTRTKSAGIGEDLATRMPVVFCKDRDRDMEKGATILADTHSSKSPHVEDRQVGVRGARCSESPGSESLRVTWFRVAPSRRRRAAAQAHPLHVHTAAGPRRRAPSHHRVIGTELRVADSDSERDSDQGGDTGRSPPPW